VSWLVGEFAFTCRDIYLQIYIHALLHPDPPLPESGRCLPGFRPGHSVCDVDKGVFFRRSHGVRVSSLIAAAACAVRGRV
jgi:hypothetical protein